MFKDFMKGRHGVDEYSVFLTWVAIILLAVALIFNLEFLNTFTLLLVIWAYYRVFSKNLIKRNSENYRFLATFWNPLKKNLRKFKRHTFGEKGYKYIYCKNCNQELRVPKHKGKVKVRCPKCKEKFEVRT